MQASAKIDLGVGRTPSRTLTVWHLADGTSPETALVVGEIAAAQLTV
jgi:hypothetical protein